MNARDADDSARNPLPPLRRRRSFLASRPAESIETEPFLIETAADPFPIEAPEDSIPVLTEVVSAEDEAETPLSRQAPEEAPIPEDLSATEGFEPSLPETSPAPENSPMPKDSPAEREGFESPLPGASPAISGKTGPETPEELAARMTRAIVEQMAYELPTLIEASLFSVCEELRNGIASTMETALRDFVARHKQETEDS
jgi:hypothetical protein